jgi:hypothetical protein
MCSGGLRAPDAAASRACGMRRCDNGRNKNGGSTAARGVCGGNIHSVGLVGPQHVAPPVWRFCHFLLLASPHVTLMEDLARACFMLEA